MDVAKGEEDEDENEDEDEISAGFQLFFSGAAVGSVVVGGRWAVGAFVLDTTQPVTGGAVSSARDKGYEAMRICQGDRYWERENFKL